MELITILVIICIFIFFRYLFPESLQLGLRLDGFKKIPKLLLKLAKIEKKSDVIWKDLDVVEQKRLKKYYDKLSEVSSIELTFLYNQNLIHILVPAQNRSYFFRIDQQPKELVHESIGSLNDDIDVVFVLHRQTRSWFRSPILTGYLKKGKKLFLKDEEKEIDILFEFPEVLVKKRFFTKRLERKYGLTKISVGDAMVDELGYNEDIYYTYYDQEHKNGGCFNFKTV